MQRTKNPAVPQRLSIQQPALLVVSTVLLAGTALAGVPAGAPASEEGPGEGYYRFPALHGDTLVFTAEGGTKEGGGRILVDKGIASAAETGVYGPEGNWLIEGHGVDPNIEVDNPPHATFIGEDAQLKAAVEHLLDRIRTEPVETPPPPPYPDKSSPKGER